MQLTTSNMNMGLLGLPMIRLKSREGENLCCRVTCRACRESAGGRLNSTGISRAHHFDLNPQSPEAQQQERELHAANGSRDG